MVGLGLGLGLVLVFFLWLCHPGVVVRDRNINFMLFSEYDSSILMVHLFPLQAFRQSLVLD